MAVFLFSIGLCIHWSLKLLVFNRKYILPLLSHNNSFAFTFLLWFFAFMVTLLNDFTNDLNIDDLKQISYIM